MCLRLPPAHMTRCCEALETGEHPQQALTSHRIAHAAAHSSSCASHPNLMAAAVAFGPIVLAAVMMLASENTSLIKPFHKEAFFGKLG